MRINYFPLDRVASGHATITSRSTEGGTVVRTDQEVCAGALWDRGAVVLDRRPEGGASADDAEHPHHATRRALPRQTHRQDRHGIARAWLSARLRLIATAIY